MKYVIRILFIFQLYFLGVLLHGPPGCGKTMIAKATAREAGMNFLYLDVSLLTDKWYGESQKLAGAVFSLAQKLQPCIIFIDEIGKNINILPNIYFEFLLITIDIFPSFNILLKFNLKIILILYLHVT